MENNKNYMKGFVPYAVAAAILSLCGGFTASVPTAISTAWNADASLTFITLAYSLAAAAMAPIMGKLGGAIGDEYAKPQGRISYVRYTDVADTAWCAEAVNYVSDKELMKGVGTGFDPNGALTRGMLVTVLYRMAGSPKVEGKVSEKFSDCTDGSWYADAVLWASANKVVDGYEDGTFKPTKSITRQEMAKVLYGYDKIGGKTAEGITEKLTYTDLDAIADWALEAVTYCTAEKYLAGSNGAFSPKGTATRAMGAKVLMNMTKEAA